MSTPAPAPAPSAPRDEALIGRWLHGRSPHTQQAYRGDVAAVLAIAGKPIADLALDDLQAVADELRRRGQAPATVARRLAAIKSLLKFAHQTGAVAGDVGRALRLPSRPNTLAERIVDQEAMQALLAAADTPRDCALVAVLYGGGLRVSEAVALQWRDLVRRERAGQVTIREGKGGKSRTVRLPAVAWSALVALRPAVIDPDGPVFTGYKGQPLTTRQAQRTVKAAAVRAGLPEAFSPHWARHAHASHSLEAGASLRLVQETLGHSSISITERYLHVRPDSSSGDFLDLVEPAPASAQPPQRGRRRRS